jgi:hypothetical protein
MLMISRGLLVAYFEGIAHGERYALGTTRERTSRAPPEFKPQKKRFPKLLAWSLTIIVFRSESNADHRAHASGIRLIGCSKD